jgi:hypothetical protein
MVNAVPNGLSGVVGVDLGSSAKVESMAFSTLFWEKYSKVVTIARCTKHKDMPPGDGADHLRSLFAEFTALRYAVVDEGGLGKGYTSEWRRRHSLSVVAAQKTERNAYIEHMNGALDDDLIKLLTDGTKPLVDELELAQWDEDRKDIDDRFLSHAIDSALYGWRDCYAWGEGDSPPGQPKKGTPEYDQMIMDKERAESIARVQKREALRMKAKMHGRWAR